MQHLCAEAFFPNTPTGDITGTPYPTQTRGETLGFYIDFNSGASDVSYFSEGHAARMLVRPALWVPPQRFQVAADGRAVKDRWTGLTWSRCPAGAHWNGTACAGGATAMTWQQAQALGAGRSDGWRLPNVKVLATLGDLDHARVDRSAFPGHSGYSELWSSTIDLADKSHGWLVVWDDFYGIDFWPSDTGGLRGAYLVRSGP
jgi:hypothetical protein